MSRITGANFDAVKGAFLIGNPLHEAGLTCNVDNNGGTTTRNVNGLSALGSDGVPSNWISKTLDVCIYVSQLYALVVDTINFSLPLLMPATFRATEFAIPLTASASTPSTFSIHLTRQHRTWAQPLRLASFEEHLEQDDDC